MGREAGQFLVNINTQGKHRQFLADTLVICAADRLNQALFEFVLKGGLRCRYPGGNLPNQFAHARHPLADHSS